MATTKIDAAGNITIHGRGSALIDLFFKDEAGEALDVSASALYFEVDGEHRAALLAGDAANHRRLSVPGALVVALGVSERFYAVIDETAERNVIMAGKIKVVAYTAEPA